jgi:hypothetical protein
MNLELDQELESRFAKLPQAEKLRLLRQDFNLQRELGKKRAGRRALAELSPTEKLRILEELRIRSQIQRGTRRMASPSDSNNSGQNSHLGDSTETGNFRPLRSKAGSHRFGGRATAGGVNYEVRVAAFIAVKMLSGNQCSVWNGINGAELSAITMQASQPVDDIVVNLRGDTEAYVFISAKERSATIALTNKSPAFADTVNAFVQQFLQLSIAARAKSRLVWAVPACVGRSTTHELLDVLETHRRDAGDTSLSEFLRGRQTKKREALKALLTAATKAWKKHSKSSPTEDELRRFIRQVYVEIYDFECGQRFERQAESDIRNHIVADSKQASHVWEKLEHFFADVNQRGIRVTPASLRKVLIGDGLALKSPPDYAEDIAKLCELTDRNLTRLKEHATLRFGPNTTDMVHIPRTEELLALLAAAKSGHLLITGEPGCGKSGLIHQLVEALQKDGLPVVLLLAEEIFGRDWKASANLPGFVHALDEVLANWPDGARGFLITDALDAVRDVETQKMLRHLLRDVQEGQSGWRVIASVREYDLQFGRELREAFPGTGVAGHASNDFAGVAHFYLARLSETELDGLTSQRAEIRPFIESARNSAKSGGIHRSPFYLRLAAELLCDGEKPLRLADWNSPAVLLRKFWEARIEGGPGASERQVTLETICRQMTNTRRMTISLKELSMDVSGRTSVNELRGRGILQAPALLHGTHVGGDEIRFTHHLLHDYAIARSLIPETPVTFCDFAIREPLLPIFYRQSFLFALEELWDAPNGRKGFWEAALKLESVMNLHGITRILAPVLAARRVESLADLQPLLTAVESSNDGNSPAQKALQHLASGLQDASADVIRAGAVGWCVFAERLAGLLAVNASIEMPLVHILARLNAINVASDTTERLALNAAGRGLLAHHVGKEVSKGLPYVSLVTIETVCRTFNIAPAESKSALFALMTPERLKQLPHRDLHFLADNLKYLGAEGDSIVLRLFNAAFTTPGPEPGQYEDSGSAIMSLRFQTSDQWSSVQYALSEYYQARNGENAALMTEVACIAWNAVVGLRSEESVLTTFQFREVSCKLIEDYSHISGRQYEYNENRILLHFEKILREWAAANDIGRLNVALDRFAVCNRTSLMWTVFMEAGAEYPLTLGVLLECVLNEPTFLTALDYSYGGTALLGALHRGGDAVQRERLEKLVLDLPDNVRQQELESREQMLSRIEYAQNRLLGALEEPNIVLESVRDLWRARQAINPLPANRRPEGAQVISHTYSNEELLEQRGISLKDSVNDEMFRLREALKPFLDLRNKKLVDDGKEVERQWPVILQCERALRRYAKQHPKMAEELWGHLVSACENIVGYVTSWPKTDNRWKTIRRILLKAATDKMPQGDDYNDTKDEGWPSWSWPAPRLDAARGLPFLAHRIGYADKAVSAALRRLCRDKSYPLRFNLADRLAVLEQASADLTWELMDTFIAHEKKFSVLDALVMSADLLWGKAPEKVRPRLRQIADRAMHGAAADNHIFETLTHAQLFHFLRTGDMECWAFIASLIADCDSQRASHALGAQLHACRMGGWLTAGDGVKPDAFADQARTRTWSFFSSLLTAAQTKLQQYRKISNELHKDGKPDTEAVNFVQEKIKRTMLLVDGVAMQLFFACGTFDEKTNKEKVALSQTQLRRFWQEAAPLFSALVAEPHPHTAHQIVQTLHHLLPCAPHDVFLLAAKSICNSAKEARFQYESLAVGDVVKLIQRALADHRDLFQNVADQESECLKALLQVLDLFVEAGWPEARQLTHRLEEIYR